MINNLGGAYNEQHSAGYLRGLASSVPTGPQSAMANGWLLGKQMAALGRPALTTALQPQPHSARFGSEAGTVLLLKDYGRLDDNRQRSDPRGGYP